MNCSTGEPLQVPTLEELRAKKEKSVASPPITATITLEISKDGGVHVGVYVVAGGVTVVGLVTVYVCVRTHYAGQSVADGTHGAGVVMASSTSR